jgi:hypothetical protein
MSELLPFIKKTLKSSDFISLDFEMSGIVKNNFYKNTRLDDVNILKTNIHILILFLLIISVNLFQ